MTTNLPKTAIGRGKRIGRGYGSGKGGHTVGRGQKGQKARGKIGVIFEGLKVKKSLLKKLPLGRGKGRFASGKKPVIIKLSLLNLLPAKSNVDLALLVKQGIVNKEDGETLGVKILGDGELAKEMTILVPISKSAARAVEKAGGRVK